MSSTGHVAVLVQLDEGARKRRAALDAAGPFVTDSLPDVRWLLCGRGRPVAAGSSPYVVAVDHERAELLYQDIERSRVEAEERWEELGYTPRACAWFEVFPTPNDPTPLPDACAVAWNPSVTGGGKSEDTALVTRAGVEVITRTPQFPAIDTEVPRA